MKRPQEAKAALRKAEELGTSDPWLQLNWGELLMQDKKYEEAAARFKRVLGDRNASQSMKISAYDGLVPYYILTHRLDDADTTYRTMIAYAPDKAWSRGNYAGFLLCWRDDYEHSIVEAEKARSLMDYGIARLTLVSALYRQWAAQVLEGHTLEARQTLQSALAVMPADPAQSVNEICGNSKPLKAVLQAMQASGEGHRISPMEAVLLAATSAPDAVPGIFALQVQATGRNGGDLFLSSEPDYRDQRNLSIRMLPSAIVEFKRKYGTEADALLKGKTINVLGSASRVKIDFLANGLPTGKYYYQTHVLVTDIAQMSFVQ